MALMRPQVHDALLALSAHSAVASHICKAAAESRLPGVLDIRSICTASGIAQSRAGEVQVFLETAMNLGLFERKSELRWRVANTKDLTELAPMLSGIHVYCTEVHQDSDTVDVVLTKPPNPSQLTQALEKMLMGTWGLLDTREVLSTLATDAKEGLVVLTPFLDDVGGKIVLKLFSGAAPKVRKQLILRSTSDGTPQPGFLLIQDELEALGVETFNFRIEKEEGNETFHAKVVLADKHRAYVGSSNMNKWSFQYSLELGLLVTGRAASRVGQVVDAILKVSLPAM